MDFIEDILPTFNNNAIFYYILLKNQNEFSKPAKKKLHTIMYGDFNCSMINFTWIVELL